MIPYLAEPVWHAGPIAIHAFGFFAAVALLTGFRLFGKRAPLYGVTSSQAERTYVVCVLVGLLGGFAWTGGSGVSLAGMTLTGLGTILALGHRWGWRILDLSGYVLPIVLAVARFGCFLAHDHLGAFTSHWLGVQFPGGSRFDLGLLYFLAASLCSALIAWLSRKILPDGVLFGAAATMLASTRLLIHELAGAGDDALDRALSAGFLAVGIAIVLWRRIRRQRA